MNQEGSAAGGPVHGQEPREEGFDLSSPVRSFMSTVRAVLFEPTSSFRRLSPRGSVRNPLVFALVCSLICSILGILAVSFDPLVGDVQGLDRLLSDFVADDAEPVAVALLGVIFLALLPLVLVLGLYIGAVIYQILVTIFVRPTDTGFEATFRVYAYASAWRY